MNKDSITLLVLLLEEYREEMHKAPTSQEYEVWKKAIKKAEKLKDTLKGNK
jgi:hypothetical protein